MPDEKEVESSSNFKANDDNAQDNMVKNLKKSLNNSSSRLPRKSSFDTLLNQFNKVPESELKTSVNSLIEAIHKIPEISNAFENLITDLEEVSKAQNELIKSNQRLKEGLDKLNLYLTERNVRNLLNDLIKDLGKPEEGISDELDEKIASYIKEAEKLLTELEAGPEKPKEETSVTFLKTLRLILRRLDNEVSESNRKTFEGKMLDFNNLKRVKENQETCEKIEKIHQEFIKVLRELSKKSS